MKFLPLPQQFDSNEIFSIICTLICLLLIYLLPKRFSTVTTVVIWLFNINLVKVTDFTLGIKPYNFYDFMDQPDYELVYYIIHFTFYPGIGYLIAYFYDLFFFNKKDVFYTFVYVILVSTLLTLLELLSLQFDLISYNDGKWSIYYSFVIYLGVCIINIKLLQFIRRELANSKKPIKIVK